MQPFYEDYVIIISIVGSIFTAVHLAYSIRIAQQRQQLAYEGDANAAKRIILPCYKPLVRGIFLFYVSFAVALSLTYLNLSLDMHRLILYYCFALLTVYSIIPVMLVQTSVSASAFWRTFYTILPYWALNTLLFGLADVGSHTAAIVCHSLFLCFATLPPLLLSLGILTKCLSSRVQLGSNSNRNATELLLVYSIVFGVVFTAGFSCSNTIKGGSDRDSLRLGDQRDSNGALPCAVVCDVVVVVLTFIINMVFPFALYRTLLADTKFWRGLGRHNQGGLLIDDSLRATGVNLHRPTMELAVASTTLQTALAEIHNLTVDFAFLALEQEVGQGATARVFRGRYRSKVVAVKLSTPPEITEEVLDTFLKEAKISAHFKHRNIVRFLGICVRPPQIGMVFEFCDGGALKTHLQKHSQLWRPPVQRLKGCLDMARAVQALHELGFIHRDIKADNFFVGKKMVVKLGDFGEATRIPHRRLQQLQRIRKQQQQHFQNQTSGGSMRRSSMVRMPFGMGAGVLRQSSVETQRHISHEPSNMDTSASEDPNNPEYANGDYNPEDLDGLNEEDGAGDPARDSRSSASKRMTILGTVAFMAPELVNNARTYSEKIDIYALGVAFWELWTLGSDPYAELSTFQIYAKVSQGERPPLPEDAPAGFNTLLLSCWAAQDDERPSATELVKKLTLLITQLTRSSANMNNSSMDSADDSTLNGSANNLSSSVAEEDDADVFNFQNQNLGLDDEDEEAESGRTSLLGSVFRLSQRIRNNNVNSSGASTSFSSSSNGSAAVGVGLQNGLTSPPAANRRMSIMNSLQAVARAAIPPSNSNNSSHNVSGNKEGNNEQNDAVHKSRSNSKIDSLVIGNGQSGRNMSSDMVEMTSPVTSVVSDSSINPLHSFPSDIEAPVTSD